MKDILVVGGGLVGAVAAVMLSQRGFRVKVYERRGDIRQAEISAGKSINLALSDRGWKALEMIGARAEIEQIAIPMTGRMMHALDGTLTYQPYGMQGQAIYSVSRGGLNARLLEIADRNPNVEIHFNERCADVDLEAGIAHFENSLTGKSHAVKADLILGSDGAFSAVRAKMQRTDRFNYEQFYLPHGYRELLLPAGPDGRHQLDKNALHIWPRGEFMLIALANEDGSFTCTLFMPFEGVDSFESLNSDERIREFFTRVFPDFTALMPDLVNNYHSHPLSSLVIVKCYPWVKGKSALIGDAAHAIVPFYGQGMNSGFEDCSVLGELIDRYGDDWTSILHQYQHLRKPDGDAIAQLALNNYIEMRDLVGDPSFLLRKKIEARIFERHPDKWMPLYSQVTFSHIRYSDALAAGKRQDQIMDEVMGLDDILLRWDSPEVEQMILAHL